MFRRIVMLVPLLLLALPAFGGEAEAVFTLPSGEPVVRVTISHPDAEITREFFEAVWIQGTDRLQGNRTVNLRPDLRGRDLLSRHEVKHPRGEVEKETGKWLVDWSGADVRLELLAVVACEIQSGGVSGYVRQESGFFSLVGFTASVGVLTVRRRDANLYAYDFFGTLIAQSTLPPGSHKQHIPDRIMTLTSGCGRSDVTYEIRGMKRKKNVFHFFAYGFLAI